jgi:hypothetical protein
MDKRTKILMPQSVGHTAGGKGHGPKGKEPDDLEFRAQRKVGNHINCIFEGVNN